MIRRWLARRRLRRACPHPRERRRVWFTDSDGRGTVECLDCRRRWVQRMPGRLPEG